MTCVTFICVIYRVAISDYLGVPVLFLNIVHLRRFVRQFHYFLKFVRQYYASVKAEKTGLIKRKAQSENPDIVLLRFEYFFFRY